MSHLIIIIIIIMFKTLGNFKKDLILKIIMPTLLVKNNQTVITLRSIAPRGRTLYTSAGLAGVSRNTLKKEDNN
jgi:hypothetical protein